MKRLVIHLSFLYGIALALLVMGCDNKGPVQTTPPQIKSQTSPAATEQLMSPAVPDSQLIPGEYIVVLKDRFNGRMGPAVAQAVGLQIDSVLTNAGITQKSVISKYKYALRGFAAHLTSDQVKRLQQNPLVDHISQNYMFKLSSVGGKTVSTTTTSQTLPWGIKRVGGPFDGAGKKAWIIDSGIDLTNSDLNVDATNSVSFISGEDPNDLNGHGTHVAGIIAAKDNSIDVVGVAAGATVISVKACNQYGNCPVNSILDALDYVPLHASSADVINMSLQVYPPSSDIDNAVNSDANNGLRFAIAAGNHSGTQDPNAGDWSPARVNNTNVWTISAFDNSDVFASFSNYGNPPIDYSEPGVNILSLAPGGGTAYKSGTSMATPHMAGLLLVTSGFVTGGYVSNDPDGNNDQIGVATPTTLSGSISGPVFVTNGSQGTWTASGSGGIPPYTYIWERKNGPGDLFHQVGTGQSYQTYVNQSFDLRLKIADYTKAYVYSSTFHVTTN